MYECMTSLIISVSSDRLAGGEEGHGLMDIIAFIKLRVPLLFANPNNIPNIMIYRDVEGLKHVLAIIISTLNQTKMDQYLRKSD